MKAAQNSATRLIAVFQYSNAITASSPPNSAALPR